MTDPELWAFCDRCQRWYHCEERHVKPCPRCESQPTRTAERSPNA